MSFVPFASDIELPFYASLANLKINHDKLDSSPRKVLGLYEIRPSAAPESSSRMHILGNALTSDDVPAGMFRAEGIIKNFNTIEEYKNLDKKAFLDQCGKTIWSAIKDSTIYSCPSLLASFAILCFADLKKYKFTYWFAFPALHSDPSWKVVEQKTKKLSPAATTALVETVQTWRYGNDHRQHGFFLARRTKKADSDADGTWEVAALSEYENGYFDNVGEEDRFVAFADPSTFPENPGWPLRNLLVLVRERWKLNKVQVLCYRDIHRERDKPKSLILTLQQDTPAASSEAMPKVTGWERGSDGKFRNKYASLAEHMDPQRLADQSVDLNLKLMKWRIAPDLDLDKIKNTKCLLLGAGTLGSYVSRNLMGWGVRKITFVDNANVSFSNPVRQPLFNFKDCLEGGAKKATRAAEALLEIYPGVEATGHVMSVPMAGHPVLDEAKEKAEYEKLEALIDEHDVVFLLMDTRESRWLPTVIAKAKGKIVMNAALGFDTYVVMRHGIKAPVKDDEVGCYFCNDVVAPGDSVKDLTLDQQCTVTRPGIAAMASALLVELLVSILQDPKGAAALPPKTANDDRGSHPLGVIPHQIRGFLSSFQNLLISGKAYDCCSACSDRITDLYRNEGWEFVKKAMNEKGYVEEVSGLAEVQRAAEKAAADIDWSDDEQEGVEEGDGELL